jgi:hypothetical protein
MDLEGGGSDGGRRNANLSKSSTSNDRSSAPRMVVAAEDMDIESDGEEEKGEQNCIGEGGELTSSSSSSGRAASGARNEGNGGEEEGGGDDGTTDDLHKVDRVWGLYTYNDVNCASIQNRDDNGAGNQCQMTRCIRDSGEIPYEFRIETKLWENPLYWGRYYSYKEKSTNKGGRIKYDRKLKGKYDGGG